MSDDEHSTGCDASGDFGVILVKHHPVVYRRAESERPRKPQQQQQQQQQPEQNHDDRDSLVRRVACVGGCIPEVSEWIEERTGLGLFGRASTDLTKTLNTSSNTGNITEADSVPSNPETLHHKDASLLTDISLLTDASLMDLVLDDQQENIFREQTAPKQPQQQQRGMKLPAFRRVFQKKKQKKDPSSSRPSKSKIKPGLRKMMAKLMM